MVSKIELEKKIEELEKQLLREKRYHNSDTHWVNQLNSKCDFMKEILKTKEQEVKILRERVDKLSFENADLRLDIINLRPSE